MLPRLLRIAVITVVCSLLGCLVFVLVEEHYDKMAMVQWSLLDGEHLVDFMDNVPPPLVLCLIITVVVVGTYLLWKYWWQVYSGALTMLPSAIEPGRRARREGIAVLAYLEQAVRMNAPLSPMLEAAARTERGRLAWRLTNLRQMLDAGADLPDALYEEVPEVSDRAIALIEAGERSGQLTAVLGRLLAEVEPENANLDYDTRFTLAYVVMMTVAMTIVIGMLGIFVGPKFQDVLHDFHVQPPALNQWLDVISTNVGPLLGIGLLLVLIVWLGYGIWATVRRRRGAARSIWQLIGVAASNLPLIGSNWRDRSWADVCRVMADGLRAGWPADEAILQAWKLPLAPRVGHAVQQWSVAVQNGIPLAEGANVAGVPRIFRGILAGAGNQTPAALDFLARYYANRFSRVRILLRGAVVPAGVLFFAGCVVVIDLSVFLPLIEMINHMAAWVGGIK